MAKGAGSLLVGQLFAQEEGEQRPFVEVRPDDQRDPGRSLVGHRVDRPPRDHHAVDDRVEAWTGTVERELVAGTYALQADTDGGGLGVEEIVGRGVAERRQWIVCSAELPNK